MPFAVYPSLKGRRGLRDRRRVRHRRGDRARLRGARARMWASSTSTRSEAGRSRTSWRVLAPRSASRSADLRDIDALKRSFKALEAALGPATVLVNNAARDDRHGWEDVTPDYYDERIATNVRHMFFAIQAVAPGMIKAGKGSIINFGSNSWWEKTGGMPVYTTAKAAVHGMTRSFARDLGPHRIRVNTVVPGWVMTERQKALWATPGEARAPSPEAVPAGPDPARLPRTHGAVPRLRRRRDVHVQQLHGRGGLDRLSPLPRRRHDHARPGRAGPSQSARLSAAHADGAVLGRQCDLRPARRRRSVADGAHDAALAAGAGAARAARAAPGPPRLAGAAPPPALPRGRWGRSASPASTPSTTSPPTTPRRSTSASSRARFRCSC